eukprot:Partr_v1_DN27872_c1_g1_i6_m22873 putative Kinesin family member
MQGVGSVGDNKAGIIPLTFGYLFAKIATEKDRQFAIFVSFLEIYNEAVVDLISTNNSPLEIKEDPDKGFIVPGLSKHSVKHWKEMEILMSRGNKNRAVGSTNMNEQSSRSHSIFSIFIESCGKEDDIVAGSLHLVDLAGSERQSKTGASGARLKEATKINLSLTSLGNCISALVERKSHVPYRDSTLTKLLRNSLGGNSKTVMLAAFSPADYNFDETVGTLRYANRAKNIKNMPIVNLDPKDASLRQYQDEIKRLKALLIERSRGNPANISKNGTVNLVSPRTIEPRQQAAKIGSDIATKNFEIENERLLREKVESQIAEIESRLVISGIPLSEHVAKQESLISSAKAELTDKETIRQNLKSRLDQRHEESSALEEQYSGLQEDIDVKSEKLQKLWEKFQMLKSERDRLSTNFASERYQLQETISDLSKELEFREKIIEAFVPDRYQSAYSETAAYDQNMEDWVQTTSDTESAKIDSCTNATSIALFSKICIATRTGGDTRYNFLNLGNSTLEKEYINHSK